MKREIFTSIAEDELKEIIRECMRSEIALVNIQDSTSPELVKAKEACKFLQVSKVTLFRWLKEGKLKGYYLGSRLYFKQPELEEVLTLKNK